MAPLMDGLAATREASRAVVVLIGFQKVGNLGIGYLSAVLRRAGFDVRVIDIEAPPADIVEQVIAERPVLVGFSLIFQYYIRRYGDLMTRLRTAGVTCHFTMGGHYPSLNPQQTLEAVPELDSVVQFEGETTLLELVEALVAGENWGKLNGVIHLEDGRCVVNKARHLTEDLDTLPFPDRDFAPTEILGRRSMPLLASRGCARTCSFCSIHTFYRTAPGKVVRLRKTTEVVREMRQLYEERGISIFLFQDDDFPLFGPKWRRWANDLVDELHASGLSRKVIWKINCRADAVEPELLGRMRDAGLYMVYMGLESGDEQGLITLNKEVTVEQNHAAVRMLKSLGIRFEYGFMLLDPSSTFASVRANVRFLREIVGDGCAAATFCKMLPYDGTPIKEALAASGRLKGDVCAPDYDFLDPRLDEFYAELAQVVDVTGWVHGPRALTLQLGWAHTEVAVVRSLFPRLRGTHDYEQELRRLTAQSNARLLEVVETLADVHETGRGTSADPEALRTYCSEILARVLAERNDFIGKNEAVLLEALEVAA